MHSGAASQAKRSTMQAEKGHFKYKFAKKCGAVLPVLLRSEWPSSGVSDQNSSLHRPLEGTLN